MTASVVVASDLEGTLTGGETWKGLRRYLRAHGRSLAYYSFFAARSPRILAARAGLYSMAAFPDRWMIDLLLLFGGLTAEEWSGLQSG